MNGHRDETSISLGFSPCPNDTFIFHALVSGLVDTGGLRLRERLEDVETLNRLAFDGTLDVTKISCHALAHLRDRYVLLRSGGALGRGCGPLLIAASTGRPEAFRNRPVAVPGRWTTAFLLLQLIDPDLGRQAVEMPFHEIPAAVAGGRVAAGLIIHESRFTFRALGLEPVIDLGAWWEDRTGHPIPLGGIIARRNLGPDRLARIDGMIRESLTYARRHPEAARNYIRDHARETAESVVRQHIELYVNDFSLELGTEGEAALRELFTQGEKAGLIPETAAEDWIRKRA